MNRKEAKEFLPIIKAFCEGGTVQIKLSCDKEWRDQDYPSFCYAPCCYRIKKDRLKSRPFANAKECFEAIKEHGAWIKDKKTGSFYQVTAIFNSCFCLGDNILYYFESSISNYVWADDNSIFGVKEV